MNGDEIERELKSSEHDVNTAWKRYRAAAEELAAAEAWVSAAIEREEKARTAFETLPFAVTPSEGTK